jgi:hypothetical protein
MVCPGLTRHNLDFAPVNSRINGPPAHSSHANTPHSPCGREPIARGTRERPVSVVRNRRSPPKNPGLVSGLAKPFPGQEFAGLTETGSSIDRDGWFESGLTKWSPESGRTGRAYGPADIRRHAIHYFWLIGARSAWIHLSPVQSPRPAASIESDIESEIFSPEKVQLQVRSWLRKGKSR